MACRDIVPERKTRDYQACAFHSQVRTPPIGRSTRVVPPNMNKPG